MSVRVERILVAVYGSLREGLGNHRLLASSEKVGTYRVKLPYYMISLGGFPGLIPCDDTNWITVEVYEVTEDTFANLDRLEGYPNFYDRVQVTVGEHTPWIYHLPSDYGTGPVVESGDWVNDKDAL